MNGEKSMSLQDIASAAFKNTIPYQATIELLTQCNLRCEHCYIPSHTCSGLPYEKVIDVLNQLRRLGTFELLLTGGEIFLRNDILDIIAHARKLGMRVVLFTNATLVSELQLRELKRMHIEEFSCTIFSMDECVHDSITHVNGSLRHTLRTMELARDIGLHCGVKTVVMKKNYTDWKAIYEYCKENGFKYMAPASLMPKVDGDSSPLDFQLDYEHMKALYEEESRCGLEEENLYRQWSDSDYICDALHYSIYVDSVGNVYPCNSFYFKVGNIWESRLEEIWNCSKEHKYILSLRKQDLKACKKCEYNQYCYKCPGNALFESGDLLACSTTDYNNARIAKGDE